MTNDALIPSDYFHAVVRLVRRTVRFWWVAAATLVLGIGATLIAAKMQVNQYRSEAVLSYQEGLQWTATEGGSSRRVGQRLKETVLARTQLAKIVEEMGLFPKLVAAGRTADAVEEMRAATGFKLSEGDIFVLSYTGASAEEAQRVTAKLTDVLIGENIRLRSEQAELARGFLDAEKKHNEEELAAKETEQLRFLAEHPEFAQEQSAMSVPLRATAKKEQETRGNDAIDALRREEERLRQQISSPRPVLRAPVDPALVAAKNEAQVKLSAAQRELADRRARFTEQHPDVRSAAGIVKEAEEAYQSAAAALATAESAAPVVDEVTPRATLEARLTQVQQEIAASQRRHPQQRVTPNEPVETSDAAQGIVALETEWARLNREVAEARQRFQQLDTKQFMASMTASMLMSGQAAQIVVIDPAFTPAQPVGMSKKKLLLMGVLAAFGLGIALAALCALLDDRVYDRADLERLALVPVLVEVGRRGLRAGRGAS